MYMPDDLKLALANSGAEVVIGPRSGARDRNFSIPLPLPPAFPDLDVTVARVESLRPDMPVPVQGGGAVTGYREELEGTSHPLFADTAGAPVALRQGQITYVGGWGDDLLLDRLVADICGRAAIETVPMPRGVRIRDTGAERFWFNHNPYPVGTAAGQIPAAGCLRKPVA
jgi:beta-galactosidase